MLTEVAVAGVFVAPIVLYWIVSIPIFFICRWVLARTGILGAMWHPALAEFSLWLIILALLVLYL
jgi:protein AaeX